MMQWTHDTPKVPGKYAYREQFEAGGSTAYAYYVLLVNPDGGVQPSAGKGGWFAILSRASDYRGEWLGPLPE